MRKIIRDNLLIFIPFIMFICIGIFSIYFIRHYNEALKNENNIIRGPIASSPDLSLEKRINSKKYIDASDKGALSKYFEEKASDADKQKYRMQQELTEAENDIMGLESAETQEQADFVFECFVESLGIQESGNNYDDVNSRTGAAGKYQIMPENWPNWAAQAGLSRSALMTPENQEYVARYKLWYYYSNYGIQGACVAWYAGEANAKRWNDNESYAMGSNGPYSWDSPQGNGDEPSVYQYVYSVISRTREIIKARSR